MKSSASSGGVGGSATVGGSREQTAYKDMTPEEQVSQIDELGVRLADAMLDSGVAPLDIHAAIDRAKLIFSLKTGGRLIPFEPE